MAIQVKPVLCAGCGVCVDTCAVGAVTMIDQQPVFDDSRCTQCGACISACPNEALSMVSLPEPRTSLARIPEPQPEIIQVSIMQPLPAKVSPVRKLAPAAGAALAFLGREVAPRLIDVLAEALDRFLTQPKTATTSLLTNSTRVGTTPRRGKRKQARYRGSRRGIRNSNGRR